MRDRPPRHHALRIAQVSPLYESVPPTTYGGTERVVSYITEELVRQGHDVTLFASGDSVTAARLVPVSPRALRLLGRGCIDPLTHHILLLERVCQESPKFDIIHYHIDYMHFAISRRLGVPHVTTLHGRLDLPDLVPLYKEYRDMPLISISDAQRGPIHWANWQGTVHHGLPPDLFRFHAGAGDYLGFLGRISPEKRVDRAIEIARRTKRQLKVAAKVDKADLQYFRKEIEPLFKANKQFVEFVGEIGGTAKEEFLGNAAALLFPIDWPEPFGLVMIESMACGTPVIAYRRGSVPEVIDHGVSGFVVDDEDGAVEAVRRLPELSRQRCRQVFEQRFLAERMTRDYLQLYRRCLSQGRQGRDALQDAGSGDSRPPLARV
jgi:glycosyltransferase involved in cell wall biosynthesis